MYNQKPLLGTPINWAHPLSKGLVGAWFFNERSGNKVFDLSGNHNHGTFGAGAAAPTWITGRNGSALDFDGTDDYVQLGSKTFTLTDFTISTWLKIPPGTGTWNAIVGYISGTAYEFDFVGGSSPYIYAYSQGLSCSSHRLNLNTWYHIILVRDSNGSYIYINGNLACSNANTTTINAILQIGRYGASIPLEAQIGELEIYNRGLSVSEVRQLYVDPYCWLAQPMEAELMYAAPPIGAIINQFQRANLGADLYDGVLIT